MKPKRKRLTPAQVKARLASHKPSWVSLLQDKLNRLSFPALTQGPDAVTEGKQFAGVLSLLRHHNPKAAIPPDMAERLERAVLERDTKFLSDFRKASKRQDPLRDVYVWLLTHYREVEACPSQGAIVRVVQKAFPKRTIDERYLRKTLSAVGLPLSKPRQKRTP